MASFVYLFPTGCCCRDLGHIIGIEVISGSFGFIVFQYVFDGRRLEILVCWQGSK